MKRYIHETGSVWVNELFAGETAVAAASLGYVKTTAALSRRLSGNTQTHTLAQLALDWQMMTRIEVKPAAMEQAAFLARRYRLHGAAASLAGLTIQNPTSFPASSRPL